MCTLHRACASTVKDSTLVVAEPEESDGNDVDRYRESDDGDTPRRAGADCREVVVDGQHEDGDAESEERQREHQGDRWQSPERVDEVATAVSLLLQAVGIRHDEVLRIGRHGSRGMWVI